MYTFIDPNSSVISEIGSLSRPYIFDDQYNEYLGIVYEDRKVIYLLASKEGFTDDIKRSNNVLLIQKTDALNCISPR